MQPDMGAAGYESSGQESATQSPAGPPADGQSGAAPSGGAAAPGDTAPNSSSAQANTDVDALAARLYERLRHRLRRELLDDRERAGLLLDRTR
jgi:hypothetical protein